MTTQDEFSEAFSFDFDPTDTATGYVYNVCPWPVDAACFDEEWTAMDPAVQTRALAFASATLYRLTGYRVGGCPIVVRPCKAGCAGQAPHWFPGAWMYPQINAAGMWVNSCGCESDCSCTELCEVELPAPVAKVLDIAVGPDPVSPDDYRVDGNRVVWTGDGDCPWPVCQDMTADVGEEGSFSIRYLNSYPVDGMGAYAAAVLAMEFAQACIGNNCRLPATVTSISRQGVSFDIPTGAFPNGFTGIREVDAYLGLWNPGVLRQQPRVWSPDLHSPRVAR